MCGSPEASCLTLLFTGYFYVNFYNLFGLKVLVLKGDANAIDCPTLWDFKKALSNTLYCKSFLKLPNSSFGSQWKEEYLKLSELSVVSQHLGKQEQEAGMCVKGGKKGKGEEEGSKGFRATGLACICRSSLYLRWKCLA